MIFDRKKIKEFLIDTNVTKFKFLLQMSLRQSTRETTIVDVQTKNTATESFVSLKDGFNPSLFPISYAWSKEQARKHVPCFWWVERTNRCSQINWQFRVACHSNYLPTVYHTLIIQTIDNCSAHQRLSDHYVGRDHFHDT